MRNVLKSSIIAVAIAGLAAMSPALGGEKKQYVIESDGQVVQLRDDDVQIVRQYYVERDCPAGLVREANACVVPNVVEQRYVIGQPVPESIVVVDLPTELAPRLPALPEAYEYRIIDGDLAIVEKSTLVVLDADELF